MVSGLETISKSCCISLSSAHHAIADGWPEAALDRQEGLASKQLTLNSILVQSRGEGGSTTEGVLLTAKFYTH